MSWRGNRLQGGKYQIGSFIGALLIAVAGLTPVLAARAGTIVGTIPGTFGVTATGAATYAIPIKVPRGAGGLTPSIALVYNSQSGSGAAGWGWTLAGLSAITRCNKTIDDDGSTAGITLTAADAYCLDGQRLLVTNGGAEGGSDTTYDAELRKYDQITSYTNSSVTGGPSYWTVQTKNGTTYEYGNTADSKIYATNPDGGAETVVRVWALDKVTDANHNYFTITYQNDDATTGDYWPTDIGYSGNAEVGTSPPHDIHFTWAQRADAAIRASFVHGALVTQTQVLTGIGVEYNGSTTFTYTLNYNATPPAAPAENRYQLASIEECDAGDGCFPDTTFTWQNGAAGWSSDVPTNVSVGTQEQADAAHLMDVNGDGIEDLVYPGPTDWMVAFGQVGGGLGAPVDTRIPAKADYYPYALAINYNGDGKEDLLLPEADSQGNVTWHVLVATGSETAPFTDTPTGIAATVTDPATGQALAYYQGNAVVADYSGQGLDDIVYSNGVNLYRLPNATQSGGAFGAPVALTALSSSDGQTLADASIKTYEPLADTGMDFDGSGRGGRLALNTETVAIPCPGDPSKTCYQQFNDWYPYASSSTGFVSLGIIKTGYLSWAPTPIDLLGSGMTDLTYQVPGSYGGNNGEDLVFELSTGTGFESVDATTTYPSLFDANLYASLTADYFGDGHQELILQPGGTGSWEALGLDYVPGSGFTPELTSVSMPFPGGYDPNSVRVGDISGRGLDDLVYAVYSGSGYVWHYALHADAGSGSDVVTSFTDGLGNNDSPSYAPLTDTASYTEGSGAHYPVQDVKVPLYVVTQYQASDGIGGTYTESYSYTGAETEVTGRGFLGFAGRTVTDSRNGVTVTDSYNQSYPFIGSLISRSVTQSNGKMLSQNGNTYASSPTTCSGGVLCFAYLSASTATVDDATSGSALKSIQTQNIFDDGYGDLTKQTVTTTDSATGAQFTTQKVIGYTPDISTYCIDLPTSISITKTLPGGASLTRTTNSQPDTGACLPASVTLNSGGTPTLTTAYGYDAWGNPQTITVSGTDLPSDHLTITDYSAYQGEYPDSINRCVVLESSTTCSRGLTSTETWDPSRGVETSMTDPNGHETQWGYDGFGRKTSEIAPDGVTQGWSYHACGPCMSTGSYYIDVSVTNDGGTQTVPAGMTEYDAKGRIVATGKVLLGGATSYVETQYDALGRPVAVSVPFLSSPAYYTDTTYDVLNRPVEITAPANASSGSGDVTTVSYNGFTATATKSAPSGYNSGIASEVTSTVTNALGEVVSKTDGSENAKTTYTYDPFGDLVGTTDADGHTTQMKYDALGHKYWMSDPNMGTWTYTVDALGEVLLQTDADGNTITQVYDPLGRRTSRIEKNASGTVTANDTWNWDTAANGAGRLASETDSVSSFQKTYTYDSLSRPIDVDTAVNGTDYQVSTSYDSFGRVSTVTYPASVAPSAPVASAAASPASAIIGNSITLEGSGSTDPNGLTLSYRWSQTAGPVSASLSSATAENPTVNTSTPGVYTFQLAVSDQNGSSTPASVSVTFDPPTPGAPTISPSPSYNGSYTVSWSGVSGAASYSYDLYQSTDVTNYTSLGSFSGTSDNLGGKTDGTYYYKVAACANNVCGAESAAVSVTVTLPPGTPPASSLSLSPNPSTNGSYTLSWGSVATATSYAIYRSVNGGSYGELTTTGDTSYSRSDGDGSYGYELESCNAAGCSSPSSTVTETVTLPPGTPATPAASPNPSTNGSFTVTWSAPSGAWTSLEFQESPNDSSWSTEATSGTSWSASGFSNGTYYFRTVYCDGGACSTSGTGSETVLYPPAAPSGLSASPNPSTTGSFTLSWNAAATASSYRVYQSGSWVYTPSGTSQSVSGLADGSYSYYVEACNASGCSGASNTLSETVLHVPGEPSSISLSPNPGQTYNDYTLSWGSATGSVGYYEVNGSKQYSATTFSATYEQYEAGSYTYYVQACNASGCGPATATLTEQVKRGNPCGSSCTNTISGSKLNPSSAPASGTGMPPISGSGLTRVMGGPEILPVARMAAETGYPVLAALASTRRGLDLSVVQPSEAAMQAAVDARTRTALPSLLPPAPAADVVEWNRSEAQWKAAHPGGPDYAPPEYIAYGNAKLMPATSTPYRFEVQYHYDPSSGALVSVSNAETGFIYWQAAMGGSAAPVDAFGHLIGWTDGNNVSTVMTYDQATGEPTGISSGIGQSSAVQQLTYYWDGYGNLTKREDNNQNLTETFGYDDLNRLTSATVSNPAADGPALDFGYDAAGNIGTKTVSGTTETYAYDPSHPYAVDSVTNVNGGTYSASYDADGNMVSRNGDAITWTPANLPASIASSLGSSTFNYGPDGNRYYQAETFNSVTTDTTYIAGGLFEVVSSSSGTTEYRHNIVADGQVVAVHTIDQNGAATTSYLHYDHLGSVDAITNDQGSVVQSMSFDAFGNRRLTNNWDYGVSQNTLATLNNYTNRGYTDQEQLDNLSLVDLNGRVYDPTVGRFISADPTVPAPLFSQAFNRYSYVYNSPLEYTDPSGYCPSNGNPTYLGDCPNAPGTSPVELCAAACAYGVVGSVPGNTDMATLNPVVVSGEASLATTDVVPPPSALSTPATVSTASGAVSGDQIPLLSPPNDYGLNIDGNNGVLAAMNEVDGFQEVAGLGDIDWSTLGPAACGFICKSQFHPEVDPHIPGKLLPAAGQALSPAYARTVTGPMHRGTQILGTMGAPHPFCGPCLNRLAQTPLVFKFVGAGAAAGATVVTGVATYGIVSKALAIAAEESEMGDTFAATLTATEALSEGGIAGLSVGGPLGALGGALFGLAIYGGYVLYEHETTGRAPQPVTPPRDKP